MTDPITTTEDLRAAYPALVAEIEAEARGELTNSTITVVADKDGRTTKWTEETRDLKDVLLGKRVDEYTYYPTGETDIIIHKEYDSSDKLIPGSEKKIKHYLGGRQPEIQKSVAEEQEPGPATL